MGHHVVVGQASVNEVVGHETIDSIVGACKVILIGLAINCGNLIHNLLYHFVGIRHGTIGSGVNLNAPVALVNIVGFYKTREAEVAFLRNDEVAIHSGHVTGKRFFVLFVFVVNVAFDHQGVNPSGTVQQQTHNLHIGCGSYHFTYRQGRQGDNGINLMEHTVGNLYVFLDNFRRAVDDVGAARLGCILQAVKLAVVKVRQVERSLHGEVGRLVSRVVTIVDYTVISHKACLLIGQGIDILCADKLVAVCTQGIVGWCKDGVVTTG